MVEQEEMAAPAATARSFTRYAWGVLAYNVAVVLWGAYVRATGSGAGCGNHWPLCNGEVTPHSPAIATLIEFTHRAMTGLDLPLIIGLVWWAWRAFPRSHPARLGAALSGVFLVTEALIGAALVKLELVARNPSAAHAWSLSIHLVNTLTLLAVLALTAWWSAGGPGIRIHGREGWIASLTLASVVILGMSGALAAFGDTLYPASSLAAGLAQDWDPSANIFLRLRGLHPLLAACVAGWLAFYAMSGRSRGGSKVAIVVVCQMAAGVLNLLLLAPVWMQIVHLLLADLLWISLVLFCAEKLTAKVPGTIRR
jgi:heme A synthase